MATAVLNWPSLVETPFAPDVELRLHLRKLSFSCARCASPILPIGSLSRITVREGEVALWAEVVTDGVGYGRITDWVAKLAENKGTQREKQALQCRKCNNHIGYAHLVNGELCSADANENILDRIVKLVYQREGQARVLRMNDPAIWQAMPRFAPPDPRNGGKRNIEKAQGYVSAVAAVHGDSSVPKASDAVRAVSAQFRNQGGASALRALRPEESPTQGLTAKDPSSSLSAAQHVLNGSTDLTSYISTSTDFINVASHALPRGSLAAVSVSAVQAAGGGVIARLPVGSDVEAIRRMKRSAEILVHQRVPAFATELVHAALRNVEVVHSVVAGPQSVTDLAQLRPTKLAGVDPAWNVTPVVSLTGQRFVWVPSEHNFIPRVDDMQAAAVLVALQLQLQIAMKIVSTASDNLPPCPVSLFLLTYELWQERIIAAKLPPSVTIPALLLCPPANTSDARIVEWLAAIHRAKAVSWSTFRSRNKESVRGRNPSPTGPAEGDGHFNR